MSDSELWTPIDLLPRSAIDSGSAQSRTGQIARRSRRRTPPRGQRLIGRPVVGAQRAAAALPPTSLDPTGYLASGVCWRRPAVGVVPRRDRSTDGRRLVEALAETGARGGRELEPAGRRSETHRRRAFTLQADTRCGACALALFVVPAARRTRGTDMRIY